MIAVATLCTECSNLCRWKVRQLAESVLGYPKAFNPDGIVRRKRVIQEDEEMTEGIHCETLRETGLVVGLRG